MAEYAEHVRPAAPWPEQVSVPGVGTVSMAPLEQVRDLARSEHARLDQLVAQAAELELLAEDRLADAGALLVPRCAWWPVPPDLVPWLHEADRLVATIAHLDDELGRLGPPDQAGGIQDHPLVRRLSRRGRLERARAHAAAELRDILVTFARAALDNSVSEVPEIGPLLDHAESLGLRAREIRTTIGSSGPAIDALAKEVELREESQRRMGFDSVHLAAHLALYGPPALESSIELDPDEVLLLVTSGALARLPHGSGPHAHRSGPGVPVEHTGIRHWMGTLLNRPAPEQSVTRVDTGEVLVTDQRVVFLGEAEALEIALASVLDIDIYLDGLAIFRLGKDEPDLFLVRSPKHVAFYINWAMA